MKDQFSKGNLVVYFLKKIMENFVFPYFTEQQKWIITQRYEGASYSTICQNWPFKEIDDTIKDGKNLRKKEENILYNKNIVMCIKRPSL